MATSMHAKKDHPMEATLSAVDKIKKTTLNATKGLCRVQSERANAMTIRNVNAYGQKEEGPSRWQERKEAKRQMYLMSTEKAVKLGVRKDHKVMTNCLGGGVRCQRCFGVGHWTFQCKNERVYVSRPSQTQKFHNPTLQQPSLDFCEPLSISRTKLEVGVKSVFKSSVFATLERSKGNKSKRTPPRRSHLRNKKRRRSKSTSSISSIERSTSKSDSESKEETPSSSEDTTSRTHSSSTFSSPSRTTSSSRKSSSCSTSDPPSPESQSKDILGNISLQTKEELINMGDIHRESQLQSLRSLHNL